MEPSLLDSDTLSAIIKGNSRLVLARATDYTFQYAAFTFSAMTRFEVTRGLRARGATARLAAFGALCSESRILPITDEVLDCAADLYAGLKPRGELISDADLIIAGTALVHRLVLVTSNTKHFVRIAGLRLDCWTAP